MCLKTKCTETINEHCNVILKHHTCLIHYSFSSKYMNKQDSSKKTTWALNFKSAYLLIESTNLKTKAISEFSIQRSFQNMQQFNKNKGVENYLTSAEKMRCNNVLDDSAQTVKGPSSKWWMMKLVELKLAPFDFKSQLLQCYVGFVGLLLQEMLVAVFLILQGQKLGPVWRRFWFVVLCSHCAFDRKNPVPIAGSLASWVWTGNLWDASSQVRARQGWVCYVGLDKRCGMQNSRLFWGMAKFSFLL